MQDNSVVIVGGGIIGLSIGWQLVKRSVPVTLFDRGVCGREASWFAAGMLAADAEAAFEEMDIYRFSRESTRRWEPFAASLLEESGIDVDYRDEGTLVVADDRDSAEALRRLYDFQHGEGIDVRWLTGAEALEIEPFLAPRLSAAVFAAGDHQVDNRLAVEALRIAFVRSGGTLIENTEIRAILPDAKRPRVATTAGDQHAASVVVLSAGAWSRQMEGIEAARLPPVRPVKGQILELRMEAPFGLTHIVRGPSAYMAPKSDGRLVVGATSEEMGFDGRVTAGGVFRLLEGAWEIVPGIADLELVATEAGFRPGSRDNQPLIGFSDAPGVYYATGHYRHGVVHAPLTAEESALEITSGQESPWFAPFRPTRFHDQISIPK